jgi:hypothetical protein
MGESQKVDNSIGRKDLWLDPRFALRPNSAVRDNWEETIGNK